MAATFSNLWPCKGTLCTCCKPPHSWSSYQVKRMLTCSSLLDWVTKHCGFVSVIFAGHLQFQKWNCNLDHPNMHIFSYLYIYIYIVIYIYIYYVKSSFQPSTSAKNTTHSNYVNCTYFWVLVSSHWSFTRSNTSLEGSIWRGINGSGLKVSLFTASRISCKRGSKSARDQLPPISLFFGAAHSGLGDTIGLVPWPDLKSAFVMWTGEAGGRICLNQWAFGKTPLMFATSFGADQNRAAASTGPLNGCGPELGRDTSMI